jgi:hypothetical protein
MAFTRYYDDPDRVMKKLQESTDIGVYRLNQPGNGDAPHFIEDPSIIIQGWGANLCHNRIDIENELRGNRPLNRDSIPCKKYTPEKKVYPTHTKEVTSASRAICPVWTARDTEQVNWWSLQTNPQNTALVPFTHNVSTRILEQGRR